MAEEQAVLSTSVSKSGPRIKGGASLVIQHFEVEMRCERGKFIESKTFKVKDATLSILVYPNGYLEEDKGKVAVFLCNEGQNEVVVESMKLTLILGLWRRTVKAENITLKGHPPGDDDTDEEEDDDTDEEEDNDTGEEEDGDIEEEDQASKPNNTIGWPQVISHKKCKTKLVDGVFKVTMEVEMLGDTKIYQKCTETIFGCYTELPKMSSQWVLEEMYRNHMKDSDFTLVCEGQKIPCHKLVLASASPYFKGMMDPTNQQFQEYKEGSVVVQCSEKVGHCFVKFLYTAEIEKTVLEDDVETFLRFVLFITRSY